MALRNGVLDAVMDFALAGADDPMFLPLAAPPAGGNFEQPIAGWNFVQIPPEGTLGYPDKKSITNRSPCAEPLSSRD